MAKKRMFSLKIVDTDEFLDMPPTTQNLYFHLCMRADDDGFVSNPKKIMKIVNSATDDIKVLIGKKFVIPFESGVCVIKHWKIHNLIRKDRYTETEYKKEKKLLTEQDNKYKLSSGQTEVIPNGNQMATQVRLGKVRLGKVSKIGGELIKKEEKDKPLTNQIVNYFFELKGWANKEKEFYKKKKIIYSRFVKPAKELLYLCDNDLGEAKHCLKKLSDWAISRKLGWSIETVFKKWYDIDQLRPKEKKPYYRGNRVFEMGMRKYILMPNGEKLEFAGKESEIIYK